MKRIVLTEGKRDVNLVEQYYEVQEENIDVDKFICEQVDHSRLKNEESEAIRNFLEPRNPHHCLAKSENGKEDLKTIFTKLVNHLVRSDAELTLIIDLDTGEYECLIDELDTRVRSNFEGQTLKIDTYEVLEDGESLIALKGQLGSTNSKRGQFYFLGFHSDLEETVGISSDDSTKQEDEKIRRFVTDDKVSSPMNQVL